MIKIAGHRLTTGRMEEVILNNNEIAECAVVAVKDFLKGQLPFAVVVKAKFFSKEAEKRLKEAGGAAVLIA